MKSFALTLAFGTALLAANPAAAQPIPGSRSGNYLVPVVIGAAVGATVGALLWPVVMPPAAVIAAPGAVAVVPEAVGWGFSAFMTGRAAIGAVIGGGLGYLSAR